MIPSTTSDGRRCGLRPNPPVLVNVIAWTEGIKDWDIAHHTIVARRVGEGFVTGSSDECFGQFR
jgi:hypothetical protein